MYSGENDVCEVTLSSYPHHRQAENIPAQGGEPNADRHVFQLARCGYKLGVTQKTIEACNNALNFLVNFVLKFPSLKKI